jgi:CMP-N-acetylneuraminic acid synthetase
MTTLAIIPARAGSKRLPGKNMKLLNGVPLIHYSLVQAKYSVIDHTVVTTDDKDVKAYAKKLMFSVIDRPNELCTDAAKSEDVVKHAIQQCGVHITTVVLLQPTSPFRLIIDIDNCVSMSKHGSVVSLSSFCDYGYKKNGAVYVWSVSRIMENDFSFDVAYIMPPERSIDIDTIEDFEKAERILHDKHRV